MRGGHLPQLPQHRVRVQLLPESRQRRLHSREPLRNQPLDDHQQNPHPILPPPQPAADAGRTVRTPRTRRPRPLHRLGPRVRLLGRPHRRFQLLQRTLHVGCQTVRQQTDGPPFPPAHVAPHLRSLRLHARIEPVRRQCALPRPAPRALRRACVVPGAPANIFLVGQVCGISNLQGWADHGPAGLTRGPPLAYPAGARSASRVPAGILPWRILNRSFPIHGLRIL